jgi:dimethylargininase
MVPGRRQQAVHPSTHWNRRSEGAGSGALGISLLYAVVAHQMLKALTRAVSPTILDCELTFLQRQSIDLELAVRQHAAYEQTLADLGARVIRLPDAPHLPDAVFVEDTAIVLDEVAVICPMGVESRRAETSDTAQALMPYRRLNWLTPPATLEGGDVVHAGLTLYVGRSARSNDAGIEQLRQAIAPYGYAVCAVPVDGCLHLKSACAFLGKNTMLLNPDWVDPERFRNFGILTVPKCEPMSADVLPIGETIVTTSDCPALQALLQHHGFTTRSLDLSELQKAEAGTTCMSILFNASQEG